MDVGLHRDAVVWLDEIKSSDQSPEAQVDFYQASVTDWAELENVFDEYAERIGGVPYLVCPGAGIYEPVRVPRPAVLMEAFLTLHDSHTVDSGRTMRSTTTTRSSTSICYTQSR